MGSSTVYLTDLNGVTITKLINVSNTSISEPVELPNGNVVIPSDSKILVYSKSGALVGTYIDRGAGLGQVDYPVAIDLDSKGNLYVVDKGSGSQTNRSRLQKFSTNSLTGIPVLLESTDFGKDSNISQIRLDNSDRLYAVVSTGTNFDRTFAMLRYDNGFTNGPKTIYATNNSILSMCLYDGNVYFIVGGVRTLSEVKVQTQLLIFDTTSLSKVAEIKDAFESTDEDEPYVLAKSAGNLLVFPDVEPLTTNSYAVDYAWKENPSNPFRYKRIGGNSGAGRVGTNYIAFGSIYRGDWSKVADLPEPVGSPPRSRYVYGNSGSSYFVSIFDGIELRNEFGTLLNSRTNFFNSDFIAAACLTNKDVVTAKNLINSTVSILDGSIVGLPTKRTVSSANNITFNRIKHICTSKLDFIYVLDTGNNRIVVLNKLGDFVGEIKYPVMGDGQKSICDPLTMDVDDAGNLAVIDRFHRLHIFSAKDANPPTTSWSQTPEPGALGWNNKPVTITLSGTDGSGWGVKSVSYQVNSGMIVTKIGNQTELSVSAEGVSTISYWSEDEAGNTEVPKKKSIKIDTKPPTTAYAYIDGVMKLVASDVDSGVRITFIQVDDGLATVYTGQIPTDYRRLAFWSEDYAGNVESKTIIEYKPSVTSVEALPTSVIGGGSVRVRVRISSIVNGYDSYDVNIATDNPSLVSNCPTKVSILNGESFVDFTILTARVPSLQNLKVTASAYGLSRDTSIQVTPPRIKSLTLNPTAIASFTSSMGTVELDGIAPVGGISINVSTKGPVRTSATVEVPEGQDHITFPIEALATNVNSLAEVTATLATSSVKSDITIVPYDLVKLIADPTSIVGGEVTILTAEISAPAGTAGVKLQLSNSNVSILTVPTVLVIASGQTKGSVQLQSKVVRMDNVAEVSADGPITTRKVTVRVLAPQLASMSLTPDAVRGGNSTVLKLLLNGRAPSGGLVVSLTCDSNLAEVSSTAFIPEGMTSVSVNVTTKSVKSDQSGTLSARLDNQTVFAKLRVLSSRIKSIEATPRRVYGGSRVTLQLTLDSPAIEPISIELSSSNSGIVVPREVVVAAGENSVALTVDTFPVDNLLKVEFDAKYLGVSHTTSVEVIPSIIKALSITPYRVQGGAATTGRIEFTSPVGPSGTFVKISANVQGVTFPGQIFVDPGLSTFDFSIGTIQVPTKTKCIVTVSSGANDAISSLDILPPSLGTLSIDQTVLSKPGTGKIFLTLSTPFTTDVKVTIIPSNPALKLQSSSLSIKKGQLKGSVSYSSLAVTNDIDCEILCSYQGQEASTNVSILAPRLVGLTVTPKTVLGGKSVVATASIGYAAPKEGLGISLVSSDPSAIVPSFVLVPSGKTTATFTITTSKVTSSKNVTITASANGVTKSAVLSVKILSVASITFNPMSVEGGVKASGLLTLTDGAPVGGMTVTLTSDNAGVSVPSSVIVPAGKNSVTFPVITAATGSAYKASIAGTANNETVTTELQVVPVAVGSISVAKSTVLGGDVVLVTVKLAKKSAADVVVLLGSTNPAVTSIPESMVVPNGMTSIQFYATTTKPSKSTSVTLSATTGGLVKTVVLKVNP